MRCRANPIMPWIKSIAAAMLMGVGLTAQAAELKWVEPFDVAMPEAKQTGKPLLVFIGDTDLCKAARRSERWWDHVRHAIREAGRGGVEIGFSTLPAGASRAARG